MKLNPFPTGLAVVSLVVALVAASPVAAQSGSDTRQDPRSSASQDVPQHQQGMDEIDSAYRDLRSVAMQTLRDKARGWQGDASRRGSGSGTGSGTGVGNTTGERDGASRTTADASSISAGPLELADDELLIAASSKGLLAGAPTSGSSMPHGTQAGLDGENRGGSGASSPRSDRPMTAGGEGDDDLEGANLPSQRGDGTDGADLASEGRTVGMLLVSVHDPDDSATGGSDGDSTRPRSDGTAAASGRDPLSVGALEQQKKLRAGVYAIKSSGSSVWLTDESGRTVLSATIDDPSGMSMSRSGESLGTRGRSDAPRGQERGGDDSQRVASSLASGQKHEWEYVFGAITKEAMTSMGWSKSESSRTAR